MATPECEEVCLYGSGMAQVFPSVKRARIAKALAYIANPDAFAETLAKDIAKLETEASSRGLKPAVRINGTSDLPQLARKLACRFPHIQFYDYTKIPRAEMHGLANYHLTFSFSGKNLQECLRVIKKGVNVAVVFSGSLPEAWHGYRVVDGDKNDLRFLDAKGVIVGLKAKGDAKKAAPTADGFVQIGGRN